jgi:hypothetical protein
MTVDTMSRRKHSCQLFSPPKDGDFPLSGVPISAPTSISGSTIPSGNTFTSEKETGSRASRSIREVLATGTLKPYRYLQKIFLKCGIFFVQKNTIPATAIHHTSTTNSPSKNHVQHPLFPKPHQKTPVEPENRFDGRLCVF